MVNDNTLTQHKFNIILFILETFSFGDLGAFKKSFDINEVRLLLHDLLSDCFFVEGNFVAGDFVSFLADFAEPLCLAAAKLA